MSRSTSSASPLTIHPSVLTGASHLLDSTHSHSSFQTTPELGKVLAYSRTSAESLKGVCDNSLPLSNPAATIVPSTSSGSSYGKTFGYVRRPDSYSESNWPASNRDSTKSEAPKINLPTRSLTIPTESINTSARPPSLHSVDSQKESPRPLYTPPAISTHPNDVLLPPKMRGKASHVSDTGSRNSAAAAVAKPDSVITPSNLMEQDHKLLLQTEPVYPTDILRTRSSSSSSQQSDSSVKIEAPVSTQLKPKAVQPSAEFFSKPTSARGRPRDSSLSTAVVSHFSLSGVDSKSFVLFVGLQNYLKCVDDVLVQYQKHSAEGRLSELMEICRKAPESSGQFNSDHCRRLSWKMLYSLFRMWRWPFIGVSWVQFFQPEISGSYRFSFFH